MHVKPRVELEGTLFAIGRWPVTDAWSAPGGLPDDGVARSPEISALVERSSVDP
jgi:hypothetical protein